MKKNPTTPIVLLIIFLGACTSGKQALEKGNYYDATLKSVHRLRQSPKNRKAKEYLAKAYPLALKYHTDKAQEALQSKNPFKWEEVLYHYQLMNKMKDEIQRSPAATKVIPSPQNYIHKINEAKEEAAAARYQEGLIALDYKTRSSAKKAFFHFQKADNLVPNFKDVRNKLDQAYYDATLKVVVEHVPLATGRFSFSYEFFYNEVFEFLREYKRNQFVKFYSPQEAKGHLNYVDQILRFRFDDFVVGETHTNSKTIQLKDSVTKTVTLSDGKKEKVKDEVTAMFTENRRAVVSKGLLNLEIVDAESGTVLSQEKLPGEFVWESRWATYQGDKRALSAKQLNVTRLVEAPPPPPQQLFIEFCKPIYAQIRTKVRHFYRKY